jgi:uncharacterized protein (DUF952 family)
MIYHIATALDWESQRHNTDYVPTDYNREGFIHCCSQEQLAGVMERYFNGKTGLVLLHLDVLKLTATVKYELSTNNEKYPHIYGPINREAIVNVMPI